MIKYYTEADLKVCRVGEQKLPFKFICGL